MRLGNNQVFTNASLPSASWYRCCFGWRSGRIWCQKSITQITNILKSGVFTLCQNCFSMVMLAKNDNNGCFFSWNKTNIQNKRMKEKFINFLESATITFCHQMLLNMLCLSEKQIRKLNLSLLTKLSWIFNHKNTDIERLRDLRYLWIPGPD